MSIVADTFIILNILKFFETIEHLDLLIIDDFGMKCLEGQQQNYFEHIIKMTGITENR